MGRTSTTITDTPVAVHAQTSQAGTCYVEAQITGEAAITLAGAIARRVHAQHLARSVGHEALVALVAGAITDHPVELTPGQAEDLAEQLRDAVVETEVADAVAATVVKVEQIRPRDTMPLVGHRRDWSA